MNKKTELSITRILKKLQGHRVSVEVENAEKLILKDCKTKAHLLKITQNQLSLMASRGLIARKGSDVELTKEALMHLKRRACIDAPFANQHRHEECVKAFNGKDRITLKRNSEESPLLSLYRRKTKTGEAFLSNEEFNAGERLRRDFTFGALGPSVTMQWGEKLGGKSVHTPSDINDETLAARQRVNKALRSVGPDLGSVLIDVCCFLKGMETLERERQWPVRSAKVVLKTALIALDRHYNPENHQLPSQYETYQHLELQSY